jgi:aminoglycoside phosphotransferase (APT) family kinase protein
MNLVQDFLAQNRERLELDRYGVPPRLRTILLTPRFRSSSHVIFLLLPDESQNPVLVAKMPRSGGASPALLREASALQAIQRLQAAAPGSVPELVALESFRGQMLLLETGLAGPPLSPTAVRRDHAAAIEEASAWLLDVHCRSAVASSTDPTWFARLIERPLDRLEAALASTSEGAWLVERTRNLVDPLRKAALPLVLAHGDFAHPNLIRLPEGRLGAVDWELGEMQGLPAGDFFLFLAYVAAARARARGAEAIASAWNPALRGDNPWARPFLQHYFTAAELEPTWTEPLGALAFARNLADRLDCVTPASTATTGAPGATAASWLVTDRHYALWKDAVLHATDAD